MVVCMPRVNISIPSKKLERIDLYCLEKDIPRSNLLVRGALLIINSQPQEATQALKNPPTAVVTPFLARCTICRLFNPNVHPVEYLRDGERATDNMCSSCENKIPIEMRIDRDMNSYSVVSGGSVENLSSEVMAVPKPLKKKRR